MGHGFFQDDKGNNSQTRLIMLLVFATFCLCYFLLTAANIYVALMSSPQKTVVMVDVTQGVLYFAGMVWAGKEIQKAIENKGTPPPDASDPSAPKPPGT
ncbi:MAG: hypothetical protein M0Z38_07835 [Deltaproteobacteria bacterium]|nr:hypothetical protein [Deltaproteobacteria bacterium]